MARFYATMQGNRGEASRMGTPNSGIMSHTRGWDVGVQVAGGVRAGEDEFDIYATGGSNGHAHSTLIGTVRLVDGEPTFIPAHV